MMKRGEATDAGEDYYGTQHLLAAVATWSMGAHNLCLTSQPAPHQ